MVSEGEQRHSTKSLVIFGVQFENSRSLPSDSTSLSSAAPAELHRSSHCTFPSPASGFIEPGPKAMRRASGNHQLLLKPVLTGISPTSLTAHPLALHQKTQALITIAVNYNLPICLLAPCSIAFIQAVLFLHCLLPELFPHLCPWPGGHMIWWGGRRKAQFPFPNLHLCPRAHSLCGKGVCLTWQGVVRSLVMFADEKFST